MLMKCKLYKVLQNVSHHIFGLQCIYSSNVNITSLNRMSITVAPPTDGATPSPCPSGMCRGLFSWDRGKTEILRSWQFKPRWDRDQGLQSSRPRRGRSVPTSRRDRAEALLCLEMASRLRRQDRGHIPHPHHSEDWCSPKKKWGKPRTEAEPKWHIQA